jgi:hypothetical protein
LRRPNSRAETAQVLSIEIALGPLAVMCESMDSRRVRTIAWLLQHLPIPPRVASSMLGWAQRTPPVPATAAEIAEEEAAEAERSATG